MKLLFSKTDYHGQWFDDDETPEGFTEKVPPGTGYDFDDDADEWVPKPEPEPEREPVDESGEEAMRQEQETIEDTPGQE
jgi:hypothetical protein